MLFLLVSNAVHQSERGLSHERRVPASKKLTEVCDASRFNKCAPLTCAGGCAIPAVPMSVAGAPRQDACKPIRGDTIPSVTWSIRAARGGDGADGGENE